MPHDISGINSGRSQHSSDRQVSSVKSEGGSSTSSATSGDSVQITDMAGRLRSLEQKLASQSEVDQSHVNEIRDAISRGEYKVDADRVADKMMDFEADF